MKKKRHLTDIQVLEISLVEKGALDEADFLVVKTDEEIIFDSKAEFEDVIEKVVTFALTGR